MLSWPRAISSFCEMMSLSRDETTMKTWQTCARPTRLPVQEAPLALQISYPSQKLHSIGITSNKNQSGDWRPWCRISTVVDQIFGGLVPASRSFMKPADSFSAFRKWWMVKWWNDWKKGIIQTAEAMVDSFDRRYGESPGSPRMLDDHWRTAVQLHTSSQLNSPGRMKSDIATGWEAITHRILRFQTGDIQLHWPCFGCVPFVKPVWVKVNA